MKISVIITTILVAQVSASFLDVFQGAVLSVKNSFGKLLSDVVTDVKDTVDCTILAVEHVLSLSEDATTRYYDKCGSGTNKTDTVSGARQDESLPKVEVTLQFPDNEAYLQKVIPAEIDARINESLTKVLGDYTSHDNLLSIENVLAKKSEQLADVSDLVKKELQKLSNDVNTGLKNIKQRDSEPSVDSILQEIKLLEKREQNSKNTSEANEIHQVIDEVLDKLDTIEATEATENIKLEEILKDLENNSDSSFVALRQQFEEWKKEESRHLGEIKNKIEEHEKNSVNISIPLPTTEITSLYEVTHPADSNTDSGKEDLSDYAINNDTNAAEGVEAVVTLTTQTVFINDNSNETEITNTTITIEDNAPLYETSTLTTNITMNLATFNNTESNDTIMTSTLSSINVSIPVNETILTIETRKPYENDSIRIILPSTSLPVIESTPVSEIIKSMETTATPGNEESIAITKDNDSNDTMRTSTCMPVSETIQPLETAMNSGNEDFPTMTMNDLKITVKIVNANDSSDYIITSTQTPIIRPLESETIETVEKITVNKKSSTIVNALTDFPNITRNDDSNVTVISSTPVSILETLLAEKKTAAENDEPSTLTTYSPIAFPATLMDLDSNANISIANISSTPFPITENTLASEIIQPVENEESFTLATNQMATIPNKVLNDTVMSTTFEIRNSQNILIAEITTTSEKQELSTQLTIKEAEATSTTFTPTESIPISDTITPVESTTVSRNEEEYGDSSKLVTDTFSSTPKGPPLKFTENPIMNNLPLTDKPTIPMHSKWLTPKSQHKIPPNKLKQQNYNTNVAPTNNHDFNDPQSLSYHLLQTRKPLLSTRRLNETPMYSKTTMPTKTFNQLPYNQNPVLPNYHDSSETDSIRNRFSRTPFPMAPDKQSPNVPNQQPHIEITAPEQAVFDAMDSRTHSRLLHSRSPFSTDDDILKMVNIFSTPEISKTHAPRKPIVPQMSHGNPPFVQTPKHTIRPPYTYRPPRGLTTHRPSSKGTRANNYKNAPIDYDSFFHLPQKDSEAHQRALREARELIENSKRSERIIDSILKNKNNYGARSIFNNPRPINTVKTVMCCDSPRLPA